MHEYIRELMHLRIDADKWYERINVHRGENLALSLYAIEYDN